MDDNSPRQQLLDGAIEYVAVHGLGDVSLRSLATALGTSHRMLIFHFGSKDGLWAEIARTVEHRQRERMGELIPVLSEPSSESLWRWWKHISDPSLWPNERLFFELYGRALQAQASVSDQGQSPAPGRRQVAASDHGRAPAADFLDGIVADWVEPVARASIARGVPESLARAHARLGVAVTRGLLLDLLATGETERVDQAMRAFIDLSTAAAV